MMRLWAAAVGIAASFGHLAGMMLMPAFAMCQTRRRDAFLVAISYYAGASWPIMPGARNFFGPAAPAVDAVALWVLAAVLLAGPWALLWSPKRIQLLWRIPVAVCIAAVPPLGIIGWASPRSAAGVLFPGTGWIGLAVTAVVPAFLILAPRQTALHAALAIAVCNLTFVPAVTPVGWVGVDTRFGAIAHGGRSPGAEFAAAQWIQRRALENNARVLIFPETVVPMWTEATDLFWQQTLAALRASGKTVAVGARMLDGNVLMIRGAQAGVLHQRIPVPLGMWKPFSPGGVQLRLFGSGVVNIAGERAAVWICYEQPLVWPILQSIAHRATVVIAIANDHWATGTPIPQCQAAMLNAWSRLFGIPLISAINR